jgi:hypothetical protein
MYINSYALEVMTKTRLAELRADAARYVLVASLRTHRPSVWAALRAMLRLDRRRTSGRKLVSPRPA